MTPTSQCQHCMQAVRWSDGAFRHVANSSTECLEGPTRSAIVTQVTTPILDHQPTTR